MTAVIDDPADERVAEFVRLNEPGARRRLERPSDGGDGYFVAEGPAVVRHLLRSPYRVRSVLVTDRGCGRWSRTWRRSPPRCTG